ncbi:unnamed protein product [Rhodiola kirilowii]
MQLRFGDWGEAANERARQLSISNWRTGEKQRASDLGNGEKQRASDLLLWTHFLSGVVSTVGDSLASTF